MRLIKKGFLTSKYKSKNVDVILSNLCKKLNLQKSVEQSILDENRQHINKGSLEAISDALFKNGINNKAVKVNKNRINELPLPAILFLDTEEQFVLVDEVSVDSLTIIDSRKGKIKYNFEDFFKVWSGIALLISKKVVLNLIQKRIVNNNSKFHHSIICFLILLFIIYGLNFFNNKNGATFFILSSLNIIGIYLTFLLLQIDIVGINETMEKYCFYGKRIDCISVSNSKFSKALKIFTLPELSFIFFNFMLLSSIVAYIHNEALLKLLLIVLLLSIPFTIIGIVYQWAVIKKWCIFCLVIDLLIWIQTSILLFGTNEIKNLNDIKIIFLIYIPFLLIFSYNILSIVKRILKNNLSETTTRKLLNSFNNNYKVIESFMNTNIDVIIDVDDIVLGKTDSERYILFVLHPSCYYCRNAFREILITLKKYHDFKVIVRLIFLGNKDQKEIQWIKLMYIQNRINGSEYVLDLLTQFFSINKNLQNKIKDYVLKNDELLNSYDVSEKESLNKSWIDSYKLYFTPIIIIDGKLYPPNFFPESLYYFLKEYSRIEGVRKKINV